MRFLRFFAASAVAGLIAGAASAQTVEDAIKWLDRMQTAPARTSYSGIFVYQQGEQVQSSRITHIADSTGSRERLEVLDGQPREFLRHDDEVRCLLPEAKRILIERAGARDSFPSLIQSSTREIAEFYTVRRVGTERVAGVETDALELTPSDNLRFGYRFWADRATGLPLKAQTLNDKGEVIEQIAFSEIKIGQGIDRSLLKSRWNTEGWRIDKAMTEPVGTTQPWNVNSPIAGFKKVREVRRSFAGHPEVVQIVFSDGLAAVSIFIEPLREGQSTQDTNAAKGAINMMGRRMGNHWMTVLGEVPVASLRLFANAVEAQPTPAKP